MRWETLVEAHSARRSKNEASTRLFSKPPRRPLRSVRQVFHLRRAKGAIRRVNLRHKSDFLQLSPPFLRRFYELSQNDEIFCIFLLTYSFLRHIESRTGTRTPRSKRPRPPSRKQVAQDRRAHKPDASHGRPRQDVRHAPCTLRPPVEARRAATRRIRKNSACAQDEATRYSRPKAEASPHDVRSPAHDASKHPAARSGKPARTTADPSQRSIPSRIVPGIMMLFRSHNPRAGTQAPCRVRLMQRRHPVGRCTAPRNANGRKPESSGIAN